MTTLSDLQDELRLQDPSAPLVFETDEGEISAGYHVTELRHYASTGINCGGNIDTWPEARIQLLDGLGSGHMNVGKFNAIVEKSLSAVPALRTAPLMVEFGHNNAGLKVMTLEKPEVLQGRVMLKLNETRAVCKPAERAPGRGPYTNSEASCC